jgi:hypothetical protein
MDLLPKSAVKPSPDVHYAGGGEAAAIKLNP